ncbi:hypothetical protein PPMP20_04315 [Paraburkholderia phymatum]|uniref:Uncharacterized protein n=1 Tax=Paraburkholderia phymatum (strain DSM 17167 / CIP 108236 / LMG 21445 / STM815) TaxID=391038 RepID=B2JD31_PARP8|nr:hypothetical protein [Paraburkholderia phymatum]ACC71087.1 hypothetical protein Bphy_1908 [Paraburkholderia phymatum STM815]
MLKLARSIGRTIASVAGLSTTGAPRVGTSKYMPHIGAKEQERAKRCWMSEFMECGEGLTRYRSLRSAPTLCQSAKPRA